MSFISFTDSITYFLDAFRFFFFFVMKGICANSCAFGYLIWDLGHFTDKIADVACVDKCPLAIYYWSPWGQTNSSQTFEVKAKEAALPSKFGLLNGVFDLISWAEWLWFVRLCMGRSVYFIVSVNCVYWEILVVDLILWKINMSEKKKLSFENDY